MKCLGSLNYISSVSRPVYHKSRAKKRGRKRGGDGRGRGEGEEEEEEWVYHYLVRWFSPNLYCCAWYLFVSKVRSPLHMNDLFCMYCKKLIWRN